MSALSRELDQIACELIYCECGGGRRTIHVADVLEAFQKVIALHELTNADKLLDAEKNGTSIPMDFDIQSRDGAFVDDQLFAVWEKQDVQFLINRLQRVLAP